MNKASRLVEQLETQLEQARASLKKKDERLKRLSEQLRELGGKLEKTEAELEKYRSEGQLTQAINKLICERLRKNVEHLDNSLSEWLHEAIKRAAARP